MYPVPNSFQIASIHLIAKISIIHARKSITSRFKRHCASNIDLLSHLQVLSRIWSKCCSKLPMSALFRYAATLNVAQGKNSSIVSERSKALTLEALKGQLSLYKHVLRHLHVSELCCVIGLTDVASSEFYKPPLVKQATNVRLAQYCGALIGFRRNSRRNNVEALPIAPKSYWY